MTTLRIHDLLEWADQPCWRKGEVLQVADPQNDSGRKKPGKIGAEFPNYLRTKEGEAMAREDGGWEREREERWIEKKNKQTGKVTITKKVIPERKIKGNLEEHRAQGSADWKDVRERMGEDGTKSERRFFCVYPDYYYHENDGTCMLVLDYDIAARSFESVVEEFPVLASASYVETTNGFHFYLLVSDLPEGAPATQNNALQFKGEVFGGFKQEHEHVGRGLWEMSKRPLFNFSPETGLACVPYGEFKSVVKVDVFEGVTRDGVRRPRLQHGGLKKKLQTVDDIALNRLVQLLDVDDYDGDRSGWLKIGMALHHGSGGADWGLQIWDEWSESGESYGPGCCEMNWIHFHFPPDEEDDNSDDTGMIHSSSNSEHLKSHTITLSASDAVVRHQDPGLHPLPSTCCRCPPLRPCLGSPQLTPTAVVLRTARPPR